MCRLSQKDAYRFVRGEEVTSTGGLRAKLSRPLDFVVISDHAEMYGLMPQLLCDPDIFVGNTVDVKNATWTNTIGSPELIAAWKDPDFDSKQRAFYYARVLGMAS
jgi:hypothetical protein